MAWKAGYGTHQQRKEAQRALRGEVNRAVLQDRELLQKSRRPRCEARKFGLECRVRDGVARSAWEPKGWRRFWKRYETAKQRDQALEAMNRNDRFNEFRAMNL